MNNPRMQVHLNTNVLPQSEEIINSVKIKIETNVQEYIRDTNGLETLTSSHETSPPRLIEFSLPSDANLSQIYHILRHNYGFRPRLSVFFTFRIGGMAMNMGLGVNSFVINLLVKLTYKRVYDFGFDFSDLPQDDVIGRLVTEGKIDKEISKSFENLLGSLDKVPTRMSCSHVSTIVVSHGGFTGKTLARCVVECSTPSDEEKNKTLFLGFFTCCFYMSLIRVS